MKSYNLQLKKEYSREIEMLGKSNETKNFLMSLLLTSRFHISSRPISDSNSFFFSRLAYSCDALLSNLQEEEWENSNDKFVSGLKMIKPISSCGHDSESQIELNSQFKGAYRKYFRGLNLLWSSLAPVEDLKITDWSEPEEIMICVGPNIGIGDEIIFYELASRLRRQFPGAKSTVSSFNKSTWDLCEDIDNREYIDLNQLQPYRKAVQLIQKHPNNLVIFVEFASTAMYRHLELLPGLDRFVYMDTGARTVRMINQSENEICENQVRGDNVYYVIDSLLNAIGLSVKSDRLTNARFRPISKNSIKDRVFVNPFSSKNYKDLSPLWWSTALLELSNLSDVREIVIFVGANDATKLYVQEIVKGCLQIKEKINLYGKDSLPPIAEMMKEAASSHVVFGLDTFTGHIGMISTTPCVTVFFGSEWDAWRVHNNHVLNAHIHDFPEQVGRLVSRLLTNTNNGELQIAKQIVSLTEAYESNTQDFELLASTIQKIKQHILNWHRLDKSLSVTFVDFAIEQGLAFESAILHAKVNGNFQNRHIQKLTSKALNKWKESNFYRYSNYIVAKEVIINIE